jgi:hypothetical protein
MEIWMDEKIYRLSAKPHPSGGFQLQADKIKPHPSETRYPSNWVCSHGDGEFHDTYEDAIDCPQYRELLGQIT